MLTVLLSLAVSDVPRATQAQFREQARACLVSLKYDAREGGPEAELSPDGTTLTVRDNPSDGPQIKCMMRWANNRHLAINLIQS